jgi:hypothetical protein
LLKRLSFLQHIFSTFVVNQVAVAALVYFWVFSSIRVFSVGSMLFFLLWFCGVIW